jgi:adenylylsulfate reductase subunit B
MSIAIDSMKCRGCGKCTIVCPGSLIDMQGGKAHMRYPKDCWGCSSCIKECAYGAIALYLGADIGGGGSKMTVEAEGDLLHWQIRKTDGTQEVITVNKKESNKY